MKFIVTDPGVTAGSIAVVTTDLEILELIKMPKTEAELATYLKNTRAYYGDDLHAVIEKVGGHVSGNSAMNSSTLNRHVGTLHMGMLMLDIPVKEVAPISWMSKIVPERPKTEKEDEETKLLSQKVRDLMRRKAMDASKKLRKNFIKTAMEERFPDIKMTLWKADTLAIACWAVDFYLPELLNPKPEKKTRKRKKK
jgi:hypothetical protein